MDTSKTSFGLGQIANETPEWANWIFRGWFIISIAFIGWASAVGIFDKATVNVITTTVTLLLNPIMYGFSKLFGIVPDQAEPGAPLVADKQVTDEGTKAIDPVIIKAPDVIEPVVE